MKIKKISLLTDHYILAPVLFLILSLIFILIPFLLLYSSLPEKLPLFYSLPWGDFQLVQKDQFLILPAVLLSISLTNLILIWQLHPTQIILKKILSLSIIAISLITLI